MTSVDALDEPSRVFERHRSQQIAGCLAYLLLALAPLAAGFVALAIGGLGFLLLDDPFERANHGLLLATGVAALGAFAAILLVAFREYRRRAQARLEIWEDRLESRSVGRVVVLSYRDSSLQSWLPWNAIDHGWIRLSTPGGPSILLRGYDWPLADLIAELEHRAVPEIRGRMEGQLRRGEVLAFREPSGRAMLVAAAQMVFILYSVSCVVIFGWQALSGRKLDLDFLMQGLGAVFGGVILTGSALSLRRWFGVGLRHGVELGQSGIWELGDPRTELRWAEIGVVSIDDWEVTIARSETEPPLRFSRACNDFHSLIELLRDRLPERLAVELEDDA